MSSSDALPDAVRRFADQMEHAQGCKVQVKTEKHGYQLYLPCPECLHTHKSREMKDPKYCINVSKYLGIGQYADDSDKTFGHDWLEEDRVRDNRSGVCMRTRSDKRRHIFKVSELLNMGTVTERHPDITTSRGVVSSAGAEERRVFWVPDALTGVKCPPPPSATLGDLIPLPRLDPSHPAREYMENRGMDIHRAWEMAQVSYCKKEWPHNQNKVWYPRMPGGWRDTPQGRIVFKALVAGSPITWQARVIDKLSPDGLEHYYWHPYKERWDLVETRAHAKARWMRVEPFDALNPEDNTVMWGPSKYRAAKHAERVLLGWDAAVAANKERDVRWAVLLEGPMDALRVGPGGLAVLGSSIPVESAKMVVENFDIVVLMFDNDKAGIACESSSREILSTVKVRNPRMSVLSSVFVPGGKDIADMSQAEADEFVGITIARLRRGL